MLGGVPLAAVFFPSFFFQVVHDSLARPMFACMCVSVSVSVSVGIYIHRYTYINI